MSESEPRKRQEPRPAEDPIGMSFADRHFADAAMALLGCRNDDDVYEVIAYFIANIAPGTVAIVNEITPDLEWLVTRKVAGLDASLLVKAATLAGFDLIGKRSAVVSAYWDEWLSGTLTRIPGGFVEFASSEVPRATVQTAAKVFGITDVFTIGIANGSNAFGNVHIFVRSPDVVLPTDVIESFIHHCYSALANMASTRRLAESAERNQLLLDSMVEGFAVHEIILDDDGKPCDYRFLDANPAFAALTGLKVEDLIGRTIREVSPELGPLWIERYKAVAMTGIVSRFEGDVGGPGRHFEALAYSPIPGQVAVLVSDITERKQAEIALKKSESRQKVVLQTAMDGFWLIGSDGCLLQTNDAYCQMSGYSEH
ncbi:MAG: PAS domain S-box protein, partial [Actinomycetota bacterium]|nr:PAS domain S-box protein [Actinomycetota bacterium]